MGVYAMTVGCVSCLKTKDPCCQVVTSHVIIVKHYIVLNLHKEYHFSVFQVEDPNTA